MPLPPHHCIIPSMAKSNYNPMAKPPKYRARWPWLVLGLIVVLVIVNHLFQFWPWPGTSPETPRTAEPKAPAAASGEVIDYGKIEQHSDLKLGEMILERKKEFGIGDSLDMVVGSEESIKVGNETISIKDILAEIESGGGEVPIEEILPQLGGGPVMEQDLTEKPADAQPPAAPAAPVSLRRSVKYYGVYVVRPGDNLWDIHFSFLRDYFSHRGVEISSRADESPNGRSTGVAKILKYAENMVHVFNMKTKRLDQDVNLLEPYEKVVVFNLTHLNLILGSLKPEQINEIRYDGDRIYLPGAEPAPKTDGPPQSPASGANG